MKRFLLAAIFCFAAFTSVFAQPCTVTNLYFNLKSYEQSGAGCTITFDIGWDQKSNGGSKWSNVHLWLANDYPVNYSSTAAPNATLLANSFGTITLNNGVIANYPNAVTPQLSGIVSRSTLPNNSGTRFLITNVTKTFTNCPVDDIADLSIKGIVWAAQDNPGGNVACMNRDLEFLPPIDNDFTVSSVFFCGKVDGSSGREYAINFTSQNPANQSLTVSYNVYVDNGDGNFDPSQETFERTVSNLTVNSQNSYTSGRVSYEPYSNQMPEAGRILWFAIRVKDASGNEFTRTEELDNSCTILPVKFAAFTAARSKTNKQQVELSWTTAQEQNNKGFYVQRNTDGSWKDVGFVFSAADNGNSNVALNYRFKDENVNPGVLQYRLLQVDLDGKTTYSPVVSVMGETPKSSVVVYPNPAVGGNVNLVFADTWAKDILVSDLSGRMVQQYRNVTAGSYKINGLKTGFYTVQITNTKTGEKTIQKIIVP